MKKAELIAIIVPGTIAQWTAETPQFKHVGKERELTRTFATWDANSLKAKLRYLKEKGYL